MEVKKENILERVINYEDEIKKRTLTIENLVKRNGILSSEKIVELISERQKVVSNFKCYCLNNFMIECDMNGDNIEYTSILNDNDYEFFISVLKSSALTKNNIDSCSTLEEKTSKVIYNGICLITANLRIFLEEVVTSNKSSVSFAFCECAVLQLARLTKLREQYEIVLGVDTKSPAEKIQSVFSENKDPFVKQFPHTKN